MAEVLVEKPVLFSGIWRPRQSADDAFLRMVSQQLEEKPRAQALWRLTSEGLTLVAQRTDGEGRQGQMDQIPVQSIKDVTVNLYNPLCLMTLYVDSSRRFNALVCLCQTASDATEIMLVYRRLQKSQSGEGYSIDLKKPQGINWMLKSKENGEKEGSEDHNEDLKEERNHLKNGNGTNSHHHHHHHHHRNNNNEGEVVVEMEEEILERESLEVEGRPCFNVGVQADLTSEDDNLSMASEVSYQSLKEELNTLSNEVRDIKILLEKTTGISAEEFFRRRRGAESPALVPIKRTLSRESEGGRSGNGEKSVNFAALPNEGYGDNEFDIRSVGMQTDRSSKRGKYMKRVRNALTPNRYRNRSESSNSSQASPGPVSPFYPHRGTDRSVFFSSSQAQAHTESRQDPRLVHNSVSRSSFYGGGGTVVRPIEHVYQAHTPGFRQKRRQVIVLPNRSLNMPRHYWSSAPSAPSSTRQRAQGLTNAAGSAAENGTS